MAQGYRAQGYGEQGLMAQGYRAQGYGEQGLMAPGYRAQGYGEQGLSAPRAAGAPSSSALGDPHLVGASQLGDPHLADPHLGTRSSHLGESDLGASPPMGGGGGAIGRATAIAPPRFGDPLGLGDALGGFGDLPGNLPHPPSTSDVPGLLGDDGGGGGPGGAAARVQGPGGAVALGGARGALRASEVGVLPSGGGATDYRVQGPGGATDLFAASCGSHPADASFASYVSYASDGDVLGAISGGDVHVHVPGAYTETYASMCIYQVRSATETCSPAHSATATTRRRPGRDCWRARSQGAGARGRGPWRARRRARGRVTHHSAAQPQSLR